MSTCICTRSMVHMKMHDGCKCVFKRLVAHDEFRNHIHGLTSNFKLKISTKIATKI